MLISGLGLLLCACVNLLALTGQLELLTSLLNEDQQTNLSVALGGGIFVVWIPAVLIAQRINNGNRLKFSWKKCWQAARTGCAMPPSPSSAMPS